MKFVFQINQRIELLNCEPYNKLGCKNYFLL